MSFSLKIEVDLRDYPKDLKGADLAVILATALHTDNDRKNSVAQLKNLEKERATSEDQKIEAPPESVQCLLKREAVALLLRFLHCKEFLIRVEMRGHLFIALTKRKIFSNVCQGFMYWKHSRKG